MHVAAADGRQVGVEIAQDARMRQPVQLSVGAVLHPDELAADKRLALFGRPAARDLVDVDALMHVRYSSDQLLGLAAEKDPGFDWAVFADALSVASSRPDAAFRELGLTEQATEDIRDRALQWRQQLVAVLEAD